ncbi:MAG: hypothetical protein ACR2GR_06215 [Rhodothermales bacterium]
MAQPTARRIRPLPPVRHFWGRFFRGVAVASVLLGSALGIGVLGYRFLVGLSWLDALLNAAMLLGGEGPLAPTPTTAGKLFASFYALFSGLVFVTVAGLVFAPIVHRFLHRFHLDIRYPEEPPSNETSDQPGTS